MTTEITVKRLYNIKKWVFFSHKQEIKFARAKFFNSIYGSIYEGDLDIVYIGENNIVEIYDTDKNEWRDHSHISRWDTEWWK